MSHVGVPITSEHYKKWPMTIGEWNLHAKVRKQGLTTGGDKPGQCPPGACCGTMPILGLSCTARSEAFSSVTICAFHMPQKPLKLFLEEPLLRKNSIAQSLLVSFYRSTIESILTYSLCVWFPSCTMVYKKELPRVIRTAEKIIGCPLTTLEDLHSSRCLKRAYRIIKDSSHLGSLCYYQADGTEPLKQGQIDSNRVFIQ